MLEKAIKPNKEENAMGTEKNQQNIIIYNTFDDLEMGGRIGSDNSMDDSEFDTMFVVDGKKITDPSEEIE